MEPSPAVKCDGDRAEALLEGNQGFAIHCSLFFLSRRFLLLLHAFCLTQNNAFVTKINSRNKK